jgi:Kef-type K+ transport system membrane component KefB
VGIAIIIAAVAGLAGFSVAIGAFFAGLIFSRDPKAVKAVSSFDSVSDLFVPFFFVGIGLSMEPAALDGAVLVGATLVVVAVVGKLLGAAFPALVCASWQGALLIGVSMVPRAEITMIIMEQGRRLGGWAVPPEVFGGMVMVAAITSLAAPFALRWMLSRWPPSRKPGGGG